jgi:tetratricopeptide (TPR) repeat protein
MVASLLTYLISPAYLLSSPVALLISAFQIWMLVDAIRQREWMWAFFILIGWGLAAFWYYFSVYRASPTSLRGFELPGAQDRRRIKELQAQVHHLDNAYHHFQLGDVYFRKGKLVEAEAAYRASLEREPTDIDARAHLGQCLLRQKKAAEALPLLQAVTKENSKHDYGYSAMALAEAYTATGNDEAALQTWRFVTEGHSYPRAKVQLAELYLKRKEPALARAEINEVLSDDAHAPTFQRRRDRVWIRRARKLSRKLATG